MNKVNKNIMVLIENLLLINKNIFADLLIDNFSSIIFEEVFFNNVKSNKSFFEKKIEIIAEIKKGNKKNIVVLTRDRSYRKTQSKLGVISKVKYRKYPKFVELMKTRYTRYNKTLEYIYDLEKRGEIFVIQPQVPLTLGRIEKNREKLEEVYKIGYNEARKRYNSLLEYLKK